METNPVAIAQMLAKRPRRLAYIGDVPVENTRAGAVQLYRLLSGHPPDRLWVLESSVAGERLGPRLAGVRYDRFSAGWNRLQHTRFRSTYAAALFRIAPYLAGRLSRMLRGWNPQAVLTVAHGYSWLTAAAVATKLKVPLHLIVHDDPVHSMGLAATTADAAEAAFARVYRGAETRLCVSPAMALLYKNRYGVDGDVLYPVRDKNTQTFNEPPVRLLETDRPLVFAYAGSVSSAAYADSITKLADVLERLGHQLLYISDWDAARLRQHRLDRPHVRVVPSVPAGSLISTLRAQADVLFVPMSFDAADDWNVKISFPSKLTDYTAAGLPLLIWGPPHCSAVIWAEQNPGSAQLAIEPTSASLAAAVSALIADPARRFELGRGAIRAGSKYFSQVNDQGVFRSVLQGSAGPAGAGHLVATE